MTAPTLQPVVALHEPPPPPPPARADAAVVTAFVVEGLASLAATLLMSGMFFYMRSRFGWHATQNLLLAAAQGAIYVGGALAAGPVSRRLGRRRMLASVHLLAIGVLFLATLASSVIVMTALLIAYVPLMAMGWPALESLVTADASAEAMSRRVAVYNLVWSGTGALMLAVSGLLIARAPRWVFPVPMALHGVCAAILLAWLWKTRARNAPASAAPRSDAAHAHPAAPAAEPGLLAVRGQAMLLSRLALPASYAVVYALGAMMPTLPVVQRFPPAAQTLVASVWMASRWLTFVFLGATVWWHTRPRALLVAAALLLLSFAGTVFPPSTCLAALGVPPAADAYAMIFSQVVLGTAMALIYAASLYFGMVLSEGSTEHGGYHEALIGVGSVLGPGFGAAAALLAPQSPMANATAVVALLGVTVLVASVASLRQRRRA